MFRIIRHVALIVRHYYHFIVLLCQGWSPCNQELYMSTHVQYRKLIPVEISYIVQKDYCIFMTIIAFKVQVSRCAKQHAKIIYTKEMVYIENSKVSKCSPAHSILSHKVLLSCFCLLQHILFFPKKLFLLVIQFYR